MHKNQPEQGAWSLCLPLKVPIQSVQRNISYPRKYLKGVTGRHTWRSLKSKEETQATPTEERRRDIKSSMYFCGPAFLFTKKAFLHSKWFKEFFQKFHAVLRRLLPLKLSKAGYFSFFFSYFPFCHSPFRLETCTWQDLSVLTNTESGDHLVLHYGQIYQGPLNIHQQRMVWDLKWNLT